MFHRKKAVYQVGESKDQSCESVQPFFPEKLQKVPNILLWKGNKSNAEKM